MFPGRSRKRSCLEQWRPPAAWRRLGCDKAWAITSKREGAGGWGRGGEAGDAKNRVQASSSPQTARRKQQLGTVVCLPSASVPIMSGPTTPQEKGGGWATRPCTRVPGSSASAANSWDLDQVPGPADGQGGSGAPRRYGYTRTRLGWQAHAQQEVRAAGSCSTFG